MVRAALLTIAVIAVAVVSLAPRTSTGTATEPPAPHPDAQALSEARARWEAAAISDYRITVEHSAFFVGAPSLHQVLVAGGAAVSIYSACLGETDICAPWDAADLTVEALFARVDDAIAGLPDGNTVESGDTILAVTYDPVFGYPVQIDLDRYMTTDASQHFLVTSLEPVPPGFAQRLRFPGIASDGQHSPESHEFARARARWETAGIADYRIVVDLFSPMLGGVLRSTTVVEGGEPLSVSVECPPQNMDCLSGDPTGYTIERLFTMLEVAIDDIVPETPDLPSWTVRASVAVVYDEALGYPVSFSVSYQGAIADADYRVTVEEFEVR